MHPEESFHQPSHYGFSNSCKFFSWYRNTFDQSHCIGAFLEVTTGRINARHTKQGVVGAERPPVERSLFNCSSIGITCTSRCSSCGSVSVSIPSQRPCQKQCIQLSRISLNKPFFYPLWLPPLPFSEYYTNCELQSYSTCDSR